MNKKHFFSILILTLLVLSGCRKPPELTVPVAPPLPPAPLGQPVVPTSVEVLESVLTEGEAREIAESECVKGGESVEPGFYNQNSKTWWFDANLNVSKEGCNPACVVSEDSSVEINWRCTGALPLDGE